MSKKTGSCLCGGVKFQIEGPLRPVSYCHCAQCRKTSGHFVAATACQHEQLNMLVADSLKWFRSSPEAQRGFCSECGASVFWCPDGGKYISIMAGTIDLPTGLSPEHHIFVADSSDYYTIDDGLPQYAEYDADGIER